MRIKKTVYTLPFETAQEKGELDRYKESNRLNADCAKAITENISASNYEPNYYDLKGAAKKVIEQYGQKRVSWVIAGHIQLHGGDARYSSANRQWADSFEVPYKVQHYCVINSHACLVDGLTDHVREHCAEKEKAAKAARAEKRGNKSAVKPTLAERLEEGKQQAARQSQNNAPPNLKKRHKTERE